MDIKTHTGSLAFFSGIAGFKPGDIDWIVIRDNPKGMKTARHRSLKGVSVFEWRYMPADELINYVLDHPHPPMQVVMFLVPDVAAHIGLTVDMLPRLRPLIEGLDEKHEYAKIIWESYIHNGSFTLTDGQRMEAYHCYLQARQRAED